MKPEPPTNGERSCRIGEGTSGISPGKLIEDYICSQNIARFGLKHETIEDHIKPKFNRKDAFYYHQYTIPLDQKIAEMLCLLVMWNLIDEDILKKYSPVLNRLQWSSMNPQVREKLQPLLKISSTKDLVKEN